MKIEFDEKNIQLVQAIAVMLAEIASVTVSIDQGNTEEEAPIVDDETYGHTTTETLGNVVAGTVEIEETEETVDKDGFTYDARIHARTKTKNADGTWKILRRPQSFETAELWESFIADVRAEQSPEGNTDLPPPNDFGAIPSVRVVDEPVNEPIQEPVDDENITFIKLMKTVTASKGAISPEILQEICEGYEITSSADLSKPVNQILLPAIYSEVMEIINA